MVAKHTSQKRFKVESFNLAKIHMVAKLEHFLTIMNLGFNLAKIHMVAKPTPIGCNNAKCFNLAKIHMVAKPQTDFIT